MVVHVIIVFLHPLCNQQGWLKVLVLHQNLQPTFQVTASCKKVAIQQPNILVSGRQRTATGGQQMTTY